MNAARKIKEYLKENGIKQTFLAEKTGIDVSTLNAILNENTRLTVDRLELICKALNVSSEIFLS